MVQHLESSETVEYPVGKEQSTFLIHLSERGGHVHATGENPVLDSDGLTPVIGQLTIEHLRIEASILIVINKVNVATGRGLHDENLGSDRHRLFTGYRAILIQGHNHPLGIGDIHRVGHLLVGEPGRGRPVVLGGLLTIILGVVDSSIDVVATHADLGSNVLDSESRIMKFL